MGSRHYLVSVVKRKMATYPMVIAVLLTLLLPFASGCNMEIAEPIIRCRSNNIDYIVKSMYVLVPDRRALNESDENRTSIVEPIEVDIFYCDVPELPNIFARMNSSLERVRVARSNIQSVTINAFEGLENKLRYLDLSGNKLRTVTLAIQNLTRLEVLNLRDNKIQVIAEGPTFSNTRHLRELQLGFNNLGYVDASKLHIYPSLNPKNNNRKSSQPTPIGLTVFNLGNITNSLEILSLRGNGMHNYPEQLLTDFPRLKSLDLSFNSLIEVPEDAFRTMPELQFVNLDSNFIRTIKFTNLPETLKLFTMKNNPMRCDCDVKWILDWIYTNTSLTVLLPKCNAPFHLREISFLRLNSERLCNQSRVTRQTVYVTDRDLGYFPQGVFQSFKLLDVRGEYKSVFVSWKVNPQFYLSQREWLIIYRDFDDNIYRFNGTRFGSKSYIENQTDWTSAERVFSDTIRNLSAGGIYHICMAVVENNINYVHLNHCRAAQTEKEVMPPQFAIHEANQQGPTTTVAPDPDYRIESNFADIKADTRAITVYWNVIVQSKQSRAFYKDHMNGNVSEKMDFPPESPLVLNTLTAIYNELKWKITYRKFTTEATTAVTIMKNNYIVTGPNKHQYTIANLQAGTGYSVCFETVDDLPNKGKRLPDAGEKADGGVPQYVALEANEVVCREIETMKEKKFPASEVAIASTISAAVAVIIVTTLFCIVPILFKKKQKSEEDVENTSQNTVHTDPENEEEDEEEEEEDDDIAKPNGHGPKWKNSHPRITSIFPIEDHRNGLYHGSFRNFNGIPPHPGSQRNGTYPKSILKKSPSAPTLSEAVRPIPILKRPSSVTDEQHNATYRDDLFIRDNFTGSGSITNSDRPNRSNGAVELMKIFTTNAVSDSESDSEKATS